MKNRNELKYCVNFALFSVAMTMATGSIIQSFMLESGILEKDVSIYMSVSQILTLLAMMVSSGVVDRAKNIVRGVAIIQLLCLPMFPLLIILCVNPGVSTGAQYICVLLGGGVVSFLSGIQTIAYYRVPYHIMDMERFGSVTAVSVIVSGICGIALSFLMTFALGQGEYYSVMPLIFGLGGLMVVLAVAVQLRMDLNNPAFKKEQISADKRKINLLMYRPFYLMIIPNLFRGFFQGIFNLAATIGYYYGTLDSISTSYMVVISNVVMLLGGYAYMIFSEKCVRKDGLLIFISSVVVALMAPMMLLGKSTIVFLMVYGIVSFAYNFVINAIPVALTRIVDYEMIGQYSAWRMLINTLGSALAGFVCVTMLDHIGGIAILAIAGSMQLVCGAAYYFAAKKFDILNVN